MDTITIKDLAVKTIVGVLPHERKNKQKITLTVALPCDAEQAARHDNLRGTLDYKTVASSITDFVSNSQFQLIETLAEKTAELILTTFKTDWVKLKLCKHNAITNAQMVELNIQRAQ